MSSSNGPVVSLLSEAVSEDTVLALATGLFAAAITVIGLGPSGAVRPLSEVSALGWQVNAVVLLRSASLGASLGASLTLWPLESVFGAGGAGGAGLSSEASGVASGSRLLVVLGASRLASLTSRVVGALAFRDRCTINILA